LAVPDGGVTLLKTTRASMFEARRGDI
jgi:hypothetical protein